MSDEKDIMSSLSEERCHASPQVQDPERKSSVRLNSAVWADLHADVIRIIFQCFGDTESWFCLSTVCSAWREALDHPSVYATLCKSLDWKPMSKERFLRKLQIARLMMQDLSLTHISLASSSSSQTGGEIERSASVIYEPKPVTAYDWSSGCTYYINSGHFVVATHAPANELLTMSSAKLASVSLRTIPPVGTVGGSPMQRDASIGSWLPAPAQEAGLNRGNIGNNAQMQQQQLQQQAQALANVGTNSPPSGVWFPYDRSPLLQFALLGTVVKVRPHPKDRALARRTFQWSHSEDHSDDGPLHSVPTEQRGIPIIPVDVTQSHSFNEQHRKMMEKAKAWGRECPDLLRNANPSLSQHSTYSSPSSPSSSFQPMYSPLSQYSPSSHGLDVAPQGVSSPTQPLSPDRTSIPPNAEYESVLNNPRRILEEDIRLYQVPPVSSELNNGWMVCSLADTSFYRKHLLGVPLASDISTSSPNDITEKEAVNLLDQSSLGESTHIDILKDKHWSTSPFHCDPNRPGFFCSALFSSYPLSAAQTLCSPFRRHRLGFAPPDTVSLTAPQQAFGAFGSGAQANGGGGAAPAAAAGTIQATAAALAASFSSPGRNISGKQQWSSIALGDACALFVAGGIRGANLYFTNFHSAQAEAGSMMSESRVPSRSRSLREALGLSKASSDDPNDVDDPSLEEGDPAIPFSGSTSANTVHPWLSDPILTATSFCIRPVVGLGRTSLLKARDAEEEEISPRASSSSSTSSPSSTGANGPSPTAVYGTAAPSYYSGRHRIPSDKPRLRRPPKTYRFTPLHVSAVTCVTLCELSKPLSFPWIRPASTRTAYAAAAAFLTGSNLSPSVAVSKPAATNSYLAASTLARDSQNQSNNIFRSDALPVGPSVYGRGAGGANECLTVRRLAASAGYDGVLAIWDPDTGTLIQLVYIQARIWSLCIHESGRFVAVGTNNDRIHVVYIDGLPDAVYVPRESSPFDAAKRSSCPSPETRLQAGRGGVPSKVPENPVISMHDQGSSESSHFTPCKASEDIREAEWRYTAKLLADDYCPPLGYSMHTVSVTPTDPHADTALSLAFPTLSGEFEPGSTLSLVIGSREVSVWDLTHAVKAFAKRRWLEFGIQIPEDFNVDLNDVFEVRQNKGGKPVLDDDNDVDDDGVDDGDKDDHDFKQNRSIRSKCEVMGSYGVTVASKAFGGGFLGNDMLFSLKSVITSDRQNELLASFERVRRELVSVNSRFSQSYDACMLLRRKAVPEIIPLTSVTFDATCGMRALCGSFSPKQQLEWKRMQQNHTEESSGEPLPPLSRPAAFKSTIHSVDVALMPHFVLLATRRGDVAVWDIEEDRLFRTLDPLLRGDICSIRLLKHGDIVCAGTMPTVQVYRFKEPSLGSVAVAGNTDEQGAILPSSALEQSGNGSSSSGGILRGLFSL